MYHQKRTISQITSSRRSLLDSIVKYILLSRMKPLGTPPLIGYSCQHFSSRTTRTCRLPTNELLRPITQAEIPQDLILWRKAACQTLSNLSSATVQIGPHLLKDLTIPWDHGMPPIEEGGGWGLNLRFYWKIFLPEEGDWTRNDCGHSILLWCLKQHSVNIEHQQNKISMAYVYIKPEVKKNDTAAMTAAKYETCFGWLLY